MSGFVINPYVFATAGGGGALSFVASTNVQDSNNTTVSKPAGTEEGDLIVVVIGYTASGVAWTAPSGFAQHQKQETTIGGNYGLVILSKVAGASEPSSYTFSPSGSLTSRGFGASYRSADTNTPISDSNRALDTNYDTTPMTAGDVSVTEGGGIVGAWLAYNDDPEWTPETGMTTREGSSLVGAGATMELADELGLSSGLLSRSATPDLACRKLAVALAVNVA